MTRLAEIVDRLPSLYRPDLRDGLVPDSLFEAVIAAVAESLDRVHRDAGEILRTRWLSYADRAEYDHFFTLSRELDPSLDPNEFPYIRDLARVGALLPLTPWEQPVELRERVEDFRLRVRRMVRLYREGLSTVDALRAVVEATLPVDLETPEPLRDRPFLVEEFFASDERIQVPTRGAPAQQLGPLMRFTLHNRGVAPAYPTFYLQGLALEHGGPSAVTNPMVELYHAAATKSFPRLGLALQGILAAGEALRLRPAFSAWTATVDGPRRARSTADEQSAANPAVDGPWEVVAGAPAAAASALLQTADRALWIAADDGGGGSSLWRFDGQDWSEALIGLPEVHALLEDQADLLIGTASGLLRMPLYPEPAGTFGTTDVAAVGTSPVNVLYRAADGQIWLGTDTALLQLGVGDTATAVGLGSRPELETPVFGIAEDTTGTLYLGTALGVFQYQRARGSWSWYEGAEATEGVPDWQPLDPSDPDVGLPAAEAPFIPAVYSLHRGPDGTLWLGTEAGLARYLARPPLTPSGEQVGAGLSLVTVLEAFPDLDAGRVFNIREDARGRVYFTAARGLFRFDGRDMWQRQADVWIQLGRADRLYRAGRPSTGRGTWHFDRSSGRWQLFDLQAGQWNDFSDPPRSTDEVEVRDLAWVAEATADTGAWDGSDFTDPVPVDSANLVVRIKPDESRVVTGGIPGLPALPIGASVWRYLSMEPPDYTAPEPQPVWSPEGRQIGTPPLGLQEAPGPARFDVAAPPPQSNYDLSVFGYPPVAQLWVAWGERRARSVLVRVDSAGGSAPLDPSILDRVWQGIQLVRPAGVRTALAVDEQIVEVQDGNA